MNNRSKVKTELIQLKRKTKWSWERMCRELHRVQGEEGVSHTTLFRYAAGKVRNHNRVTSRWIQQGIGKLNGELT